MSLNKTCLKDQPWIGRIFYRMLLVVCLSGVFYIPDQYTDRFFTSGMIWLGVVIPVFFCLYLLFVGRAIRFPLLWLYIGGCMLVAWLYAAGCHAFSFQSVFFSIVLLLLFLMFGNSSEYISRKALFFLLSLAGVAEAVWGIGQYFWLATIYNAQFPVTGSFENPAGLAAWLAVLFPFALYFVFDRSPKWRVWGVVSVCFIIVGVVLCGSRTGMIAVLVAGVWSVFLRLPFGERMRRMITWSVGGCLVVLLCGLYLWKKDSADGRLLIWRSTLGMIAGQPLWGHGPGSFGGKYMTYQASYLQMNPDDRLERLADNVKHPFNEYLKIAVEYGLAGLLLVVGGMVWLWRIIRRVFVEEWPLFLSLTAFAVCSLFSYPLNYPSVSSLLFIVSGVVVCDGRAVVLMGRWKRIIAAVIAVGLLAFAFYWKNSENEWNNTSRLALAGHSDVLPLYKRLYPFLRENPLFLYNYGAELHERECWQESALLLEECAKQLNDTDVQMLLAENYSNLDNFSRTEECLMLASRMCPGLFVPLYRLVELYRRSGREAEAQQLARLIVGKFVKVPSYTVDKIKREMEEYIAGGVSGND